MKVIRWLDKNFEEVVMMTLLALLAIIMFVQVILRYVFNSALPWAEELCRYMFIWFSCMGFATGVKNHDDLRVDGLYNKASRPVQIGMDVIISLSMLCFAGFIGYGGISVISQYFASGTTSTALHLPMGVVYLALMAGLLFMILRIIQRLIKKQKV